MLAPAVDGVDGSVGCALAGGSEPSEAEVAGASVTAGAADVSGTPDAAATLGGTMTVVVVFFDELSSLPQPTATTVSVAAANSRSSILIVPPIIPMLT